MSTESEKILFLLFYTRALIHPRRSRSVVRQGLIGFKGADIGS